jgi:SSS family solute:Na+ symporter
MVGAVLSTFNSVLNSAATLWSHGVYRTLIDPDADDRAMVRNGRICSVVLALAAMVAAPFIDTEGSLYNYLQQINATFFGPMLAVVLAALFTRRISAAAAKVALIVGPVLFYLINFAFSEPIQRLLADLFSLQDPVHFLHLLAGVFVLTVLLMVGVSAVRPAGKVESSYGPPPVEMTPWRHARLVSVVVTVLTVGTYVALAQ